MRGSCAAAAVVSHGVPCARHGAPSFPRHWSVRASLLAARRAFTMPPIEPLIRAAAADDSDSSVNAVSSTGTTGRPADFSGRTATSFTGNGRPLMSSGYVRVKGTAPGNQFEGHDDSDAFRFAVTDAERGQLDHGVSPAALDFAAEAEAEYRASSRYLHEVPGGAGMPETQRTFDPATGQVRTTTRIAAPMGETYVPSSKARHAVRGTVGEIEYQQDTPRKFLLDERAHLNLRKERQLEELLAGPMPLLGKADEVARMLKESFYSQSLALQPRTAETAMLLFGHASLELRLEGRTREQAIDTSPLLAASPPAAVLGEGGDGNTTAHALPLPSVPFLDDMKLLYSQQKAAFTAPTPVTVEQLMMAIGAITEPNRSAFQLANRLLLDCDKYVLLPTRTTYAAYFTICRTNDAVVPFAVARLKDAVVSLNVSLDAPMATELLRGLNEGGYVEEAVALLARLEKVPLSTPLLNASLETLLLSKQATSCFSAFEAAQQAALRPNADTYTLLLLACEQSGQWGRVTTVLADMQRRRIKGNAQTLNLLLKGLLTEKLLAYAAQLYRTMEEKGVEVWPSLEEGVRRASRRIGEREKTPRLPKSRQQHRGRGEKATKGR